MSVIIELHAMIKRRELKIKELERNMCIYAREEMGQMNFDNDKDALDYFDKFAARHDYK